MSTYDERVEKLKKSLDKSAKQRAEQGITKSSSTSASSSGSGAASSGSSDRYVEALKKSLNESAQKRAGQETKRSQTSFVDSSYINNFVKDVNDFYKSSNSAYSSMNWGNASSVSSDRKKRKEELDGRYNYIKDWLSVNRSSISREDYNSISSMLNAYKKDSKDILKSFDDASKSYAQFESQDAYDKYIAYWEDYNNKSGYDLTAGQEEIAKLEAERDALLSEKSKRGAIANGRPYAAAQNEVAGEYTTGYGITNNRPYAAGLQAKQTDEADTRIADLDRLIAQKTQYLNSAKQIQKLNAYDDTVKNADFDQYDDYAESKDQLYNWINDLQYRKEYEAGYRNIPNPNAQKSEYVKKGYDRMNESEIAIYNYYYNKSGKEAAQKYLDTIQERLNHRVAEDLFNTVKEDTALEMVFGVTAGLNQFGSGVQNLLNFKDDYIAQSAHQIASGMVREDLADNGAKLPEILGGASLGQVAYDAITTSANMAPSILASFVLGAGAGSALMGASAAGSAYQEALNQGYDKGQAKAYGLLVGASEIAMEKVLGGISAFGGNIWGKNLAKNVANADSALKMIAKKMGAGALSEFREEYLQEILTPVFQNLMLKTDNDVTLVSAEAIYAGILGALTGGIMEGAGATIEAGMTTSTGKQLKAAGELTVDKLKSIGSTFSADSVAYQLAGKVNENTGAYTIGRLFNEIGATMTEQNINEIAEVLMQTGNFDESTAKKNAQVLAAVVAGAELSRRDVAIIESNDALADAARKVLIDQNTTWNQRTMGYNEVLKDLAMKVASRNETASVQKETASSKPQEAKNVNKSTQEDVSTDKIKSISKDGVVFEQKDGSEVSSKDVTYADAEDGLIYEAFTEMRSLSADAANEIIKIRKETNESGQLFANVMHIAYEYGYANLSEASLLARTYHGSIPNSIVDRIYQIGKEARAAEDSRRSQAQKSAPAGKAAVYRLTETGEVKHLGEGKKALEALGVNERKSVGVQTAQFLNKIGVGGNFYFVKSYVNEAGKSVFVDRNGKVKESHNGMYYSNGDIYIDLNAGRDSSGITLFTVSHELAHFIQQWDSTKYRVLADFLAKTYAEKGISAYRAIKLKQRDLSDARGTEVTFEEAYHEFVADSLSTMFSDGNLYERLLELKKTDKSVFDKIRSYINTLARKAKEFYSGEIAPTREGQFIQMQSKETIDRLQQLFADALVGASENYRGELNVGEDSTVVNQNGDPVAHATEDGSVQLSMSTYESDGRNAFRKYLQKCVTSKKLTKAEMQEMLDGIEDIYRVCKEFKDTYAPFSAWSDAAVVRDTRGRPVFSVVTPNGDYKMNLDFSLVCKKRRTLDAVFNEMSRRGIIDDFELGQKSVVKINEIIRKHGLETACALCFVDAKRFRQASMADQFTSLYNELVESLVPDNQRSSINHFNFSGYETIKKVDGGIETWANNKLDFSHIDHVLKTYGEGTVEYKAAKYIKTHPEGRKLLLRGDFMSSQGFDAVKTQNQDILKLYNSKKGTGGPKAAFGDVQYLNEIIGKARTWTPAKAYAVGGVRIQSFSDYVPRMVFDYVQMIYDLAATKLPAHAYTKEALFVKQFGLTGIKINMSLIPAIAEGGIAAGLDANGNYVWAGESFDFETAKQIQNADGYTENCGTICVGVSDRHIRKLLSDPDIRMVIPYHKSGLNPIVAHMNKIAEFTDYTKKQNTTVKGTGAKADKHFDFNKALHDMGENADPKAVIQQYFDWCDNNGYDPKFADFRDHPNYYKLIEDFTLYDKDGKYVPQSEVRAVFPKETDAFGSMKDLIKEGLEEDAIVEGKRDMNLSAIVDEIQRTIPKTEAEISDTEQVEQADRDLEAGVQYSTSEANAYSGVFKDYDIVSAVYSIRNVAAERGNDLVRLGVMPTLYNQLFELSGDVYVSNEHLYRNMVSRKTAEKDGRFDIKAEADYHDLGEAKIISAIEQVQDPIAIMESLKDYKEPRLVAILDEKGNDGNNLLAVLEIYTDKTTPISKNPRNHVLFTIYEKSNLPEYIKLTADKKRVLYIKKGTSRETVASLQLAGTESQEILNKNIAEFKKKVKAFKEKNKIYYSTTESEPISNRTLLANALESLAHHEVEKKYLREYKEAIETIEKAEKDLQEVNSKIRELSFAKGPRNKNQLMELRDEARKLNNRINLYDKKLLRLEASEPLMRILDREKKTAYQRGREKAEASLKRSTENRNKTAMRHKIQNVVKELNSLLLTNDKKRHVPDNLKKAVADALDLVNMDTVDAENRAAKYADMIAKEQAKANPDQDKIDSYTMTMENILRQGEKMGQRINELHSAYEEIANSNDPDIANAYDSVITGAIKELSATIGNTSLKNMTIEQLSDVYDVYKMVLNRVRDANKAMAENIKESISRMATQTVSEVKRVGGEKKYRAAILDPITKFGWNNMKPVYAMETIGSSTLTNLFNNVRSGEDVWAKDITEARTYYLEKAKKYGYDKWDFDKKYKFTSDSGIDFELTLEQMMSLYAYSRREQAIDHLRLGGFVFDSNIETVKEKGKLLKYKVNTADAHQVTPEIMAEIVGKLTKEQTNFVQDMQDYLSTVMGAKGNEVTSKMYGVKLFKEKFYFPLKSAKQFMFEQNEVAGEVRIKNSGFTNKVVANANNPVILSNFMDVWSNHVNDMSMYHAFTLPLEDFNRVFNYNSPKQEGIAPVSVKGTIQNAYGPAAVQYMKQLITDLNGGARTDSTAGIINKLMGMFKKGAVFASLSVVVQQPSAVARAAALIDLKYFDGYSAGTLPRMGWDFAKQSVSDVIAPTKETQHNKEWEELKKYAPVAIIKEMGYFDTNMGKSTQDYITGKVYDGFGQKMKALATDNSYRDEILSKAPALADEVAWCAIWRAVKREMVHKHPDLRPSSDAMLKFAGERFTEVISKTQVYDSVLSRSANMRSKDTGMKMATAFMAEPTTSANMVIDAIIKGKRGEKRYARKAVGAVIASVILNSILVSFVYAARDDDEDETYAEKYLASLSGSVIDSLNPATYIPFIKDIVSIVQGYDVERSDMAVVSDLWNAWKQLKSENVSTYKKVENFAGSIAQIFGLPVKNIMRDARGIYNAVTTITGDLETTKAGVRYAIGEAVTGKSVPNKKQLYEARLAGDTAHEARVAALYDDADSADAAVRAAIKDAYMDNEIDEQTALKHMVLYGGYDGSEAHWTMDEWKYNSKKQSDDADYSRYYKIYDAVRNGSDIAAGMKELTSYGYSRNEVLSNVKGKIGEWYRDGEITKQQATTMLSKDYFDLDAEEVGATINEWSSAVDTGISYDDIKAEYMDGNISAHKAEDMYVKYGGYTQEEAKDKIAKIDFEIKYGFAYDQRIDAYKKGKVSSSEMKTILMQHGNLKEKDAEETILAYEWMKKNPQYDVDVTGAKRFAVRISDKHKDYTLSDYNVNVETYLEYVRRAKDCTGVDDDGDGYIDKNTKAIQLFAMINTLPISAKQKDALAYITNAKSTIEQYAPWRKR